MRVTLVAGQDVVTPITLQMAKDHLGIMTDTQDEMIRGQMRAAFEWAEENSRRAIASRNYLVTFDDAPHGVLELPLGYVTAVDSVAYTDADGNAQTWDSANYEADLATEWKPRVRPTTGGSWPTCGDYLGAFRVTITAGWSQASIPYSIKQSILLKIGSLFASRVPGDDDPTLIENAAREMLAAWTLPPW